MSCEKSGLASAVNSSIASCRLTTITIAIQAVHQQLVGIVVLPKLILLFVAKPPIVTNVAMLYHHSSNFQSSPTERFPPYLKSFCVFIRVR